MKTCSSTALHETCSETSVGSIHATRSASISRRRFLAAAGVAAAAGGIGAYAWLGRDSPIALACIDFVMKEEAKSIMMGAMPRAEAEKALAGTLALWRIEGVGQVRHVGPCPFNGATAYHVVLAVPQGKVTLLVMPEGGVSGTQKADHDGLYASAVALRKGGLGVIGTDRGVVDSVVGALRT
ncbi:MAG TPA: twin-arginine translocation signal domain-containing protein [Burkholderiales bacterium]|nr:twin-arginine translocation signal domain-containing protein [Burkholderiales bacterium]